MAQETVTTDESKNMHELARKLKAKTDEGAAICFDGELWVCPRWRISKHVISFKDKGGNYTQMIMERGDDPAEVEAEMRKRIRLLMPVHID